ncbi:hypothetical protein NC651_000372 [Populus alba x Populus x berolinensis]|nr:hypothetical protein NC651_000372 [Populus alba x Populus x berolinensis]
MRPCPEDSSDEKIRYPIIRKRKEKELMNTSINAQICSASAAFPVAKTTHHMEAAEDNLTKFHVDGSEDWIDISSMNHSTHLTDLFYDQ